jgi:formate/nitrite transporter
MTALGPDALLPPEMAARAEDVGVRKARLDTLSLFALAVLAGAFISLGAIFATTVSAGTGAMPFGIVRLLAGLAFSLGLILVIVGGAELFTGNALIVMAWASGKIDWTLVLRNWTIVYVGNLAGALGTVAVMLVAGQYAFGGGSVGASALAIGNAKAGLEFVPSIALGMMCNALVCLAVWLSFSARTTTDRILAIIPPITAFVAAGSSTASRTCISSPWPSRSANPRPRAFGLPSTWRRATSRTSQSMAWSAILSRSRSGT